MKKILFILAILMPTVVFADQFTANIKVDGKDVPAEFVTTGDNTCALGSGRNACISQYSENKVKIPKEVTFNNKTYKVEKINSVAFRFCSKITEVYIPDGVTSVGDFAFIGCKSLKEIELPSTLKTVSTGAFMELPNLKKVKCNAKTPPTWEYNDVFYFHKDGIGSTESPQYQVTLVVPTDAISAYQNHKVKDESKGWITAEGWGNFNAITDGQLTLHIENAEEMEQFRKNVNMGIQYAKVELANDIDMKNVEWTEAIGNSKDNAFKGIFEGNGFTISNLKVKAENAGLFGYIQSAKIGNLVLKNLTISGTDAAGALCGYAYVNSCSIDSVFAVNNNVEGKNYCGGLVGRSDCKLKISESVVKGGGLKVMEPNKWLGGFIGEDSNHECDIWYCALLGPSMQYTNMCYSGPFIGASSSSTKANVYNSFSTWGLGLNNNNINHEKCVYHGVEYAYKDDMGQNHNITFEPSKKQTIFTVGALGLNKWVYCPNEYPLPACFEDSLPDPKVNVMTLRPKDMPSTRVNGLSLRNSDDFDEADWNDYSGQSDNSWVLCGFETSTLWVDGNLGGSLAEGMVPIRSMSILANEGLRYDRVLKAERTGEKVYFDMPIFEKNEDGTAKFDDDGQPIIDGYETIEEDEFLPVMYPLMLPYHAKMPHNCEVFKPVKVLSDVNGVATVELQIVEGRNMDAYTPYFVVVNADSVNLGTSFETYLDAGVNNIELNDDYEFTASPYFLDKTAAEQNKIYLVNKDDELKWDVMSASTMQNVPAFQAYFRAKRNKTSQINLTLERVEDEDFVYELSYNIDNSLILSAIKYKGEGGDVVVPNTVTANVSGTSRTLSVAYLGGDLFTEKAGKISSIDLTECESIDELYVDRSMKGTPFYGLKENTLVFLPDEKGFPSVNVVVGDTCRKLLLKEGVTFYSPYAFKANNVEYKRAMASNDYFTICLPYSAPIKDGLKYYTLSGVSDATLQFKEVNKTEPGVPYMVVTSSAIEDLDIDAENDNTVTDIVNTAADGSSVQGFTMHGTFEKISASETVGKYVLQSNHKWQKVKSANNALNIDVFRAYLTGSSTASETMDSKLDGDITGIKNIRTTDIDGTEHWYDLNGHRINSNPSRRGVYIRKGKKIAN